MLPLQQLGQRQGAVPGPLCWWHGRAGGCCKKQRTTVITMNIGKPSFLVILLHHMAKQFQIAASKTINEVSPTHWCYENHYAGTCLHSIVWDYAKYNRGNQFVYARWTAMCRCVKTAARWHRWRHFYFGRWTRAYQMFLVWFQTGTGSVEKRNVECNMIKGSVLCHHMYIYKHSMWYVQSHSCYCMYKHAHA